MFLNISLKRFIPIILCFFGLAFGEPKNLWAQALLASTPAPPQVIYTATPTIPFSYEEEKRKLELERVELENEKLKFEMEKMKAEATKTTAADNKDDKKELELLRQKSSEKAEALAKDNKDKSNLLILDLVNHEGWNKGVRYNLYDLYSMAEDQKITIKKHLDKRDLNGDERNRYVIRNISLLRYNGRTEGIITVKAPVKDDDFQVLTLENISFDSPVGDIRNAYQNGHFMYDGEGTDDNLKWLRYKYSGDFFKFSDKLKFVINKDAKLSEIRFGVLDEN